MISFVKYVHMTPLPCGGFPMLLSSAFRLKVCVLAARKFRPVECKAHTDHFRAEVSPIGKKTLGDGSAIIIFFRDHRSDLVPFAQFV